MLKAVGAHGATMGYLLQRLHDLHVKTPWSDSLSAHHDFLTVMTSDEAFVEVSRQRFALKELVVSQCGEKLIICTRVLWSSSEPYSKDASKQPLVHMMAVLFLSYGF